MDAGLPKREVLITHSSMIMDHLRLFIFRSDGSEIVVDVFGDDIKTNKVLDGHEVIAIKKYIEKL